MGRVLSTWIGIKKIVYKEHNKHLECDIYIMNYPQKQSSPLK